MNLQQATKDSYHDLNLLDRLIKTGAVALIHGKWLLQYYENNLGKLPHRQQLEQAQAGAGSGGCIVGWEEWERFKGLENTKILVVSYPWLSEDHPDPDSWHLERVATYIHTHLKDKADLLERENNRQKRLGQESRELIEMFSVNEVYVFWDWVSLYQRPRTSEQNDLFRTALSSMDIWYAHEKAHVLVLDQIPPHAANRLPYTDRGWCTFEQQVYSLASKGAHGVSVMKSDAGQLTVASAYDNALVCIPRTPNSFRALLATKTFTNKEDTGTVADLYERVFKQIAGSYAFMTLNGIVDDQNAKDLCEYFQACKISGELEFCVLSLSTNPHLTDIGNVPIIKSLVRSHNGKRMSRMEWDLTPAANLSCLFALAFIPRRVSKSESGDGNSNGDGIFSGGHGDCLAHTREFWCFDEIELPDKMCKEALAALCHIFGRKTCTETPHTTDKCHWVWSDGSGRGDIHIQTKRTPPDWVFTKDSQECVERPGAADGASNPCACLYPPWHLKPMYAGGLDRSGKALGFGTNWTADGNTVSGFWLDDQLLPTPLTVAAVNSLEGAILQDLVDRGRLTKEQALDMAEPGTPIRDYPPPAHNDSQDTEPLAVPVTVVTVPVVSGNHGVPAAVTYEEKHVPDEEPGSPSGSGCCTTM
eukprot:GDKI01000147.1.p1 GENE.GDKI01000147.1~~GDKI01000147.1.p1  ORF type:complete len:645 (+),score=70.11 GDKI01000147.1:116-2050(+)